MEQNGIKKRNIGLDLFRIALAILIFMFHSNMHFDCHYGILERFVKMGAIAMTGFFMLSGYSLSISNKSVLTDINSLKTFFYKRFVSIFPLYYFVAIVYIILFNKETWQSLLLLLPIEMLCLQSCFSSLFSISHNGGTWFISCLVFCYLVFPFVQWIYTRISVKHKYFCGGVMVAILFLAPLVQRHFQLASIYTNPFFRILEFCIGIIIAQINNSDTKISLSKFFKSKLVLLFVVVIMISGVSLSYDFINTAGRDYMMMNWVSLPCFILIFLLLGNVEFRNIKNSKIILYCSNLSYSFFLAQFFIWPISYKTTQYLNSNTNIGNIVVSFLICMGVSIFLHEFVEKPSAKLLSKTK